MGGRTPEAVTTPVVANWWNQARRGRCDERRVRSTLWREDEFLKWDPVHALSRRLAQLGSHVWPRACSASANRVKSLDFRTSSAIWPLVFRSVPYSPVSVTGRFGGPWDTQELARRSVSRFGLRAGRPPATHRVPDYLSDALGMDHLRSSRDGGPGPVGHGWKTTALSAAKIAGLDRNRGLFPPGDGNTTSTAPHPLAVSHPRHHRRGHPVAACGLQTLAHQAVPQGGTRATHRDGGQRHVRLRCRPPAEKPR